MSYHCRTIEKRKQTETVKVITMVRAIAATTMAIKLMPTFVIAIIRKGTLAVPFQQTLTKEEVIVNISIIMFGSNNTMAVLQMYCNENDSLQVGVCDGSQLRGIWYSYLCKWQQRSRKWRKNYTIELLTLTTLSLP